MKFYLAARYYRREELVGYADTIERRGHHVTSRWLLKDPRGQHGGFEAMTSALKENIALEGWEDVRRADALIAFSEPENGPGGQHGARHAEFGMAIGLGKPVFLVGRREHVFHFMPGVQLLKDWPHALEYIGVLEALGQPPVRSANG